MTYGLSIWGSSSKENIELIFKLQKRALRYLCHLNYQESCKESFLKLKILTVPALYVFHAIMFTQKRQHLIPTAGQNHTYLTRYKNNLSIPAHKKYKFEKQTLYQGIKFFNKTPKSITTIENNTKLKKSLKNYLLRKCLYDVEDY